MKGRVRNAAGGALWGGVDKHGTCRKLLRLARMAFIQREILVRSSFGPIRAIVTAEAIEALWAPDGGPNLGQNIIETHRAKLERIVYEKFAARAANDQNLIEIRGADVV